MRKVFCTLRYGALLGLLVLGILVMMARRKLTTGDVF